MSGVIKDRNIAYDVERINISTSKLMLNFTDFNATTGDRIFRVSCFTFLILTGIHDNNRQCIIRFMLK